MGIHDRFVVCFFCQMIALCDILCLIVVFDVLEKYLQNNYKLKTSTQLFICYLNVLLHLCTFDISLSLFFFFIIIILSHIIRNVCKN